MALDRAPQFLSVLLLFAIPFLTQPGGTDILFPKKVVTQVLVYLMACAWLLRTVLTGKAVIILSKALVFLSLFLLWSGLTLFFSPYSQAGSAGLLDFTCFPLWYVLLTFTCLEAWRAENLLVVFLASGLGACFWAMGQAFGMGAPLSTDPTSWGGGVMAGMGDPENLAGYLQMVWPLALALYLRAKKPAARLFWSLLFFSSLTALVLTGSGAGWAGLLAGSLLFAFFAWRDGNKTALKWLVPLAAVLYFYAFHSPVSGKGTGFLEIKGEKARVQLQIWRGAVEMIKDRPLLGSGFGTFAQAFPSYRSQPVLAAQKERGFEVGHARNGVLDSLAETGWVGFLLFIAFWFHVLAQWWKLYSANAIPKVLAAGAFAAFGAVAVNNLFDANGHLPSTLVPLFFLAAFPVALSQRFYRVPGFPIQLREIDLSRAKIYLLPLLALAVGVLLQQVVRSFERQASDIQLKAGMALSREGKWDEALARYERALWFDPGDIRSRYQRAKVYSARGQEGDMEKALEDLDAVGRVAPDHLQLHFEKSRVLRRLGRMEDSRVAMKRAIQLDPLLIHLWDDFKETRRLSAARKFTEALPLYRKMVLDYPDCVPLLTDFARCLLMVQRFPEAIGVYQRVRELDPGNREVPANLGGLSSIVPADR